MRKNITHSKFAARSITRTGKGAAIALTLALSSLSAHAQRASENAVTSAQDAFGTSVGDDTIGLYSSTEARGFSPKDAGNFRLDGLYYDQQGNFGFSNQLSSRTSIRVGLSAQSYPFPAPTGIADIRLRLPGEETLISFSSHYGPYGSSYGAQVDLDTPIIDKKLGAVLSVGAGQKELDFHSIFNYLDFSGLLRWTPNDSTEFISFLQHSDADNGESNPFIFTGGAFLPPKVDRDVLAGPDFKQGRHRTQTNIGLIGRSTVFENWRLQAGLFRSTNKLENDFSMLYRNTQPDGTADLSVRSRPTPWLGSYSGEVRASGVYTEGPRRHTLHFSAKGRAGKRLFGGEDTIAYGTAMIGDPVAIPKPTFNLGPQSRDKIRHGTVGASYVGLWRGIGEISVGLQKAFYRRTVNHPARTPATTRNNPWLYNGTIALYASDTLTFYGSYTRGLEDSGIAPENAANPGEALAASLTEQVDAGLRYKITSSTTFVAGVFEVSKPYFDRDLTNLFTQVGSLRHRGVEMSLSAAPLEGLKVVAGAMFLQARISGSTVDQGVIGEVPPGRPPVLVRFNANYGPAAWRGFSINGQVNYEGAHNANRINTIKVSSLTTLDLGARYDFEVSGVDASLRFDVKNLTDEYIWTVSGASGQYTPSPARRYTLRLAADF